MTNIGNSSKVDDLIAGYMIYKVRNGYEPKFLISEFIDFLKFLENKVQIKDLLYDSEKMFKRFFERKEGKWTRENKGKRILVPHMDMQYSEENKDYFISANYELNFADDYKGISQIKDILDEYLSHQTKRTIDESTKVEEQELMIGKYLSAEIITQIWGSYIEKQVRRHMWPEQCNDINEYLFETDLATIIKAHSIKDELIEFYNTLSKRVSILYHQDKELKGSTFECSYLRRANYDLLIQDYEEIMSIAFAPFQKSMQFDLSSLTFEESHEFEGISEDPEIKRTEVKLGNDKAKRLINNIEKYKNNVM